MPTPIRRGPKSHNYRVKSVRRGGPGAGSFCARRPFQELDSPESDRFRRTLDVTPDRSRPRPLRERETEALDRQPTVGLDIAERLKNGLPLHGTRPGKAAIV